MQKREDDAGEDGGEQADPRRSGVESDGTGGEGGEQHLALDADVEHAGAFGIEAAKTGKQDRRRQADGRIEDREENAEIHHTASLAGAGTTKYISGRNRFSNAPANRMTRAWMTRIMSREIAGMAKDNSAPPW